MKKIIVIGASGFVGSHILSHVRGQGHAAVGTWCNSKRDGLLRFDMLNDSIETAVGKSFLKSEGGASGVICSAISKIDRCFSEKELSHKVNVEHTIRLLEEMTQLGIRPVFLSTDNVFDGSRGGYSEEDTPNPVNEYGRQKSVVERYVLENVPKALVLRLSKIVGSDPREQHMFSDWYQSVRQGRMILCIREQTFSPTCAGDVARGTLEGIRRNLTGLYHLVNPEVYSREELARDFLEVCGLDTDVVTKPVEEFGFLDKRALRTSLDGGRFERATGMSFTPMRDVMRSMRDRLEPQGFPGSVCA